MNRRELLRIGQRSLLAAMATGLASGWLSPKAGTPAESESESELEAESEVEAKPETPSQEPPPKPSLKIQWLGHSCFLFVGDGLRFLVNPFSTVGCTAGYRPVQVEADLVLISSRLLDEGNAEGLPGNPRLLFEPGAYQFRRKQIQGIRMRHDRQGGRRFGINVAWGWTLAGIKILHLGGAAAPITTDQQILMGRPDLLFVPVGGGAKSYNAQEAKQAIETLKPKLVIPTLYRTQAANPDACDILPIDRFLSAMEGTPIEKVKSDSIEINPDRLPETGRTIKVLSYEF